MQSIIWPVKLGLIVLAGFLIAGCRVDSPLSPGAEIDQVSPTPTPVLGEKVRNEGNGIYDLYDEELIKESKDKKIILFFSSDTCSDCRLLDKDILSNKDDIPENLVIMKVDYEAMQELRQKYSIDKPNNLVMIKSNLDKVNNLPSAKTLDELLKSIN